MPVSLEQFEMGSVVKFNVGRRAATGSVVSLDEAKGTVTVLDLGTNEKIERHASVLQVVKAPPVMVRRRAAARVSTSSSIAETIEAPEVPWVVNEESGVATVDVRGPVAAETAAAGPISDAAPTINEASSVAPDTALAELAAIEGGTPADKAEQQA